MSAIKSITPAELRVRMKAGNGPLMIDVREEWEHNTFDIGGNLIPLGEIMQRVNEIPKDREVVIYCEKGIRSTIAIQRLEALDYKQLCNLEGGLKAFRADGI